MPNTSVRAAAEGLPKVSRRSLIASLAIAATASAATGGLAVAGASAPADGIPVETPVDRIRRHLYGLRAACEELTGYQWQVMAVNDCPGPTSILTISDVGLHDPKGLIGTRMRFGFPIEEVQS